MNFYTFIITTFAICLGFFVQTIVGFSAPLIAMPILLLVTNLQEAVSIVTLFTFIFGIALLPNVWKDVSKKLILEVASGSLFGTALGIYFLKYTHPIILKKLLGVFILAYVIYDLIKKIKLKNLKYLGLLFGFVGGIFSGMFSSGAPIYVTFISNKLDSTKTIRATTIIMLWTASIIRLPMLVKSGILTGSIITKSTLIFPFFLASIVIANYLHKRVSEKIFKKIVIVFLVLSALSLMVK